jgi:hypothetical protein
MNGVGKYVYAQRHVTVWDIQGEDGKVYRKPTKCFLDIRSKQALRFEPEEDFAYAIKEKEESEEADTDSASEEGPQDQEGLREGEEG